MSNAGILDQLQQAVLNLEDGEVNRLLEKGLKAGAKPSEMISEGLSSALAVIGEDVETGERSLADLVIAGEIVDDAIKLLVPLMASSGQPTGDTMVIGTVEGDRHNIGKRVISAVFAGAGYRVVDIGENVPASEFVRATREQGATIVAASALLEPRNPNMPHLKVIHDALVEAGIRDDVIYLVGGLGMTQEWCDSVGADAFGEGAVDALAKVEALLG